MTEVQIGGVGVRTAALRERADTGFANPLVAIDDQRGAAAHAIATDVGEADVQRRGGTEGCSDGVAAPALIEAAVAEITDVFRSSAAGEGAGAAERIGADGAHADIEAVDGIKR